jgi:hypothetical protein
MKSISLTLTLSLLLPLLAGAQASAPQTPAPSGLEINKKALTKSNTKPANGTNAKGKQAGMSNTGKSTTGSAKGPGAIKTGGTTTSHSTGTTATSHSTGSSAQGKSTAGTTTTGSTSSSSSGGAVTQSDAASAIRQALINGIQTGVSMVAKTDGYFGNPEIKIPLPSELQPVDEALRMVGAGEMVDKLVLQLNRSAEQAATQATPIFLSSINQLTINDAVAIISNQQQDAATQFLKRSTTEQLVSAFKPQIRNVLDQIKTDVIYSDVIDYYNKIPFVSPVNSDLSDYVTRRALDGLFVMIAKEEAKIRQNPSAQASSILSRVFGSLLHKK